MVDWTIVEQLYTSAAIMETPRLDEKKLSGGNHRTTMFHHINFCLYTTQTPIRLIRDIYYFQLYVNQTGMERVEQYCHLCTMINNR